MGEKYNDKAFQIMHNMMVAHALAVLEYKGGILWKDWRCDP